MRGCGCPLCGQEKNSKNQRKSHKIYVDELRSINPNIIVVEPYIDSRTRIKHRCAIHDIEWDTTPSSALQGCGCPQCGSEKISQSMHKTHKQYEYELNKKNNRIQVIEEYRDALTPILHRCLTCSNEWYVSPANTLHGSGCPVCNESHGERSVRMWLLEHDISFVSQKRFHDCIDKKPLPFDFYLPDYNAVIEYNGIQHYSPVSVFGGEESLTYTKKHDEIKEKYCRKNNINYLCISYTDNIVTSLNNFIYSA